MLTSLFKNQKGFAAIFATMIILAAVLVVASAISLSALTEKKITRNSLLSAQAYLAAESGVEDSLYRIIKGKNYQNSNSLDVGQAETTINISDSGGQKIIAVSGQQDNRFRNLEVILGISAQSISFHYGVQVGEGGLSMDNGSSVQGNVYSNGPISGANNASVTGDVWVAGSNTLDSLSIGGHAHAHRISDCAIAGDAYYQEISDSSVAGASYPGSPDPAMENMPISETNIEDWKTDAEAGGVYTGNYILDGSSASLGPKKIIGNLTVANGADFTVTGTIYVTGSINISNNAKVRLGADYGSLSGVVLTDGMISVSNNSIFYGNGQSSFLLFLSDKTGEAIDIANNANTVIFYASRGNVSISNNAILKEVTAYQITLSNNSQVIYESGLASAKFSSGPGAGWEIKKWEEKP